MDNIFKSTGREKKQIIISYIESSLKEKLSKKTSILGLMYELHVIFDTDEEQAKTYIQVANYVYTAAIKEGYKFDTITELNNFVTALLNDILNKLQPIEFF